jgi:hypothetical protein
MKLPTQKRFARLLILIFAAMFAAMFAVSFPAMSPKILPSSGVAVVFAQKPAGRRATAPGPVPATASGDVARAHPFEPTEGLVYVAEFSRALLRKVDVADFRFSARREPALPKVGDNGFGQDKGGAAYLLRFTGEVSSKGFFSKLFNLRFREQIESIVEPSPFTLKKTKRVDEQGKRARISESIYTNGKVLWIESDPNDPARPPRTASVPFTGQVQDVLSAIYYLRTQPLEIGKTFVVTVSDSGRVYQVPVHVMEKKRMKTVLGRVEALRVDPDVYGPNGMVAGEGHFSIWLTNDSRRIPVSARIKTEYGTFDITLRKVIQNPAPAESLASK